MIKWIFNEEFNIESNSRVLCSNITDMIRNLRLGTYYDEENNVTYTVEIVKENNQIVVKKYDG